MNLRAALLSAVMLAAPASAPAISYIGPFQLERTVEKSEAIVRCRFVGSKPVHPDPAWTEASDTLWPGSGLKPAWTDFEFEVIESFKGGLARHARFQIRQIGGTRPDGSGGMVVGGIEPFTAGEYILALSRGDQGPFKNQWFVHEPDGRWTISNRRLGGHYLHMVSLGEARKIFVEAIRQSITARTGEGSLSIRLTGSQRQAEGSLVRIRAAKRIATVTRGLLRFDRLPAGTHRLEFVQPGLRFTQSRVQAHDGWTETIDLEVIDQRSPR